MIRIINLMNGTSLFRQDVTRGVPIEIRERKVEELDRKIKEEDGVVHEKLIADRQNLVKFKDSYGWYYSFLERCKLSK